MRVIDGMRAEPVKPVLVESLDDASVRHPELCETRKVCPVEVMAAATRDVSDISLKKPCYQSVREAQGKPVSYEKSSAQAVRAREAEAVPENAERMDCRPADGDLTLGELFRHSITT